MKLGYFVPNFPGQTHIFFHNELEAMRKEGVEPVIFSTTKPPAKVISHPWSEQAMSQTHYLGLPLPHDFLLGMLQLPWRLLFNEIKSSGAGFAKDLLFCIAAGRRLKKICKKEDVHHVHVHSCAKSALIAALAKLMGGPGYSLTLHGPLSFFGAAQGFKWRHAAFATIITKTLYEVTKQQLGADAPQNIFVQPMGVDLSAMQRQLSYIPYNGQGPLRLFSCGRLNEGKGHQDVIAAVSRIRKEGIDAKLTIAGEDDLGGAGYRKTLEALISELDLKEHVTLLGAVDSERIRKELDQTHIFVLASRSEALGVVYMEAMACETPTIGSDTGGVPELIEHGQDGLLVTPKDQEALILAIKQIADDDKLASKLSKNGRAKVMTGFSSQASAECLINAVKSKD